MLHILRILLQQSMEVGMVAEGVPPGVDLKQGSG
jgi:hypothetical protein